MADAPQRAATPGARRNKRRALAWARRVFVVLLLLAGAAALFVALRPQPTSVDVARVRRGDVRVTIEELGKTRVRDRYLVSAPIGGSLLRIELRPGDEIAAGQALARIVPVASPLLDAQSKAEAEARAAAAAAGQRQADAAVAQAELASKHAASDLERDRKLAAGGALPADALARAELEASMREEGLRAARFARQMAAHEAEMARAALRRQSPGKNEDHFEVTSPIQGRVLRVHQASAGVVAPGTPLVEVGDPAGLEVQVDVLTADAIQLRPGASATIERWGGPPLAAHVKTVEPSAFTRLSALGVEEQRVSVVLDLDEPRERWAALGDGFRVEVHVVASEQRGVLVVPLGATFRAESGWAVYRVRGETVELAPVTLGARSDEEVAIASGLEEGDVVLVHPSEKVRPGARVAPR